MAAIDVIDRTTDELQIASAVHLSVAAFGFEHFLCGTPKTTQRRNFDACILMNRWPSGWFEMYRACDFQRHDPIARFTHSQFRSANWSDIPIPDDPKARSIMSIAAVDFRLRRGVSVPIHGLSGYQAGISFAGFEIEETADARSAVELIAIYAFNKLLHMKAATAGRDKILTPRQREILSWIAIGKTAWDVGQILEISEDTVNKLVASAIQRLKVSNRTHAVVEAIRRREIEL
nr:LuxR family transcriptional regulator [Rhodopseudomonas sp.]